MVERSKVVSGSLLSLSTSTLQRTNWYARLCKNLFPRAEPPISSGSDVDCSDKRGFFAIHRVAEIVNLGIVIFLLKEGGNAAVSVQYHAALTLAKNEGHEGVTRPSERSQDLQMMLPAKIECGETDRISPQAGHDVRMRRNR